MFFEEFLGWRDGESLEPLTSPARPPEAVVNFGQQNLQARIRVDRRLLSELLAGLVCNRVGGGEESAAMGAMAL